VNELLMQVFFTVLTPRSRLT